MAPQGGAASTGAWGGSLYSALADLAPEAALYTAVLVAAFVPCLVYARRTWPKHKDHWGLADTFVSIVVFPLLTASATVACLRTYHDVESRWRAQTSEGRFFLMLYTTRTILHVPVQCMQAMKKQLLVFMTVHHVLSVLCFGGGLVTGHMHFWGCLDGMCEMSTIFLNNLYLCKEVTIGGRELKDIIPGWLYAANGFCLWAAFLVFRLMLFPTWLYFWYRDVSDSPAATWDRSTPLERYLYPSVTALLLGLSAFWFVGVTRGLLKALGLQEGDGKKERKAE